MLDFQLSIDPEVKELLKNFVEEIKTLNEHFLDFKKMATYYLGFKIVEEKEKK